MAIGAFPPKQVNHVHGVISCEGACRPRESNVVAQGVREAFGVSAVRLGF